MNRSRMFALAIAALAPLAEAASPAQGQVFVANNGNWGIGEYDATTGATINASLDPDYFGGGIAVSGSSLFVANHVIGTISEFTTSGALVNASLVSGLNQPTAVAVSGSDLFVENLGDGTIGKYNAITGATVNAPLVSGLTNSQVFIAVSGSDLYVMQDKGSPLHDTISKYSTSGVLENDSMITGLVIPKALAASGSDLFVSLPFQGIAEYTTSGNLVNSKLVPPLPDVCGIAASGPGLFVINFNGGTIGEYDATTGATINASLVSGLSNPAYIAVVTDVPEPGSLCLLALGGGALWARRRKGS